MCACALSLEEFADASNDFKDIHDAGFVEFLLVIVLCIDGNEAQLVRIRRPAQDFNGTDGVQYHCIDFTILDVVECALAQGNNVSMVYFGLHGVPGDIAPEAGFLESPYYNVGSGHVYLRVEHLIESADKVHIVVRCADGWAHGCGRHERRIGFVYCFNAAQIIFQHASLTS